MELTTLFYLGLAVLVSFFVKLLFSKLKLPEVTGYVLAGIILGTSLLHIFNSNILEHLEPISSVALGFIAFIIGIELKFSTIQKLGKSIVAIVILESFGAFILVFATMMFAFKGNLPYALILGAVAAATAPAATIAVMRQYKARGPLSSTIVAVVGIDDAVALIIYVFASSFTVAILGKEQLNVLGIIGSALLSVLLALLMGGIAALVFLLILKKIKSNDLIAPLLVAFILILLGLSDTFHLSELLSIMSFGSLVANLSPTLAAKSEDIVQTYAPLFLASFFIFGGAHLDITLITQIGILGILFFVSRGLGKIGGASLGASLGKASPVVKKYIGFALLPQVGVALALALSVKKTFDNSKFGAPGHELAIIVINILLLTTIFTEIIGPLLTRHVLTKAGEINTDKSTGE